MKRLLLLLLAVTLLAGCGTVAPAPETTAATTTEAATEATEAGIDFSAYASKATVLCYNIYYQDVDVRAANILDLIKKNDPGILLLQEVSVSWIPHLQTFMADERYAYYGYGRYGGEMSAEDLKSGDQFVPILWKTELYDLVESGHFWLSSTPEVYSSDWVDGTKSNYPRCVNWVILKDKTSGSELAVMNIHTDPESNMVRTNSCVLAMEKLNQLRGDRPAVVAGDWNMGLTDTGYSVVTSSGFVDLRVKAETTDMGGSFNAWGERKEGNFAYGDHIFMTEDMVAELYDVVDDRYDGEHISDHNPLLAILYYN